MWIYIIEYILSSLFLFIVAFFDRDIHEHENNEIKKAVQYTPLRTPASFYILRGDPLWLHARLPAFGAQRCRLTKRQTFDMRDLTQ